jgi:hypothetical protein
LKAAPYVLAGLVACTLSLSDCLGAGDGGDELIIAGESRLEVHAGYLRQAYPDVKANLESVLGWKLLRAPRVLLTGDRDVFERMSGNPLISAFAVPERHSIVIYLASSPSETYVLRETFEHELCHLLLHEHIKAVLLPKWLDEGVCQWISGSFGEILEGKRIATVSMNLSRHPIPLGQLTSNFPKDKDSLIQAYLESRLFVDFLVVRYGKEAIVGILQQMKGGRPIEHAVQEVLSQPLENLEREWLEELRGGSGWLLWISQYLYEVLFFLAAVLTIVAYVRAIFRKKGYKFDEDDEE